LTKVNCLDQKYAGNPRGKKNNKNENNSAFVATFIWKILLKHDAREPFFFTKNRKIEYSMVFGSQI